MSYKLKNLFLLFIAYSLSHASSSWANSLSVNFIDDLVSIEAVNVSVLEIADRLSELTGITISHTEGNDQIVTISIYEEPLKTAVGKLAENNVVVTKTVNGKEVIAEIMILLPDAASGSIEANLPSGEPAEEIIVEEAPVENVDQPIEVNSEAPNAPETTE